MSDDRVLVNLGAIPGNSHKEKIANQVPKKGGRDDRIPMKTVLKNGKGLAKKGDDGILTRIVKRFIDEDVDDLQSWFIDDVLIPGLKNLFVDSVDTIFGTGSRSRRGGDYYYTDYRAKYKGRSYEKEKSYKREERKEREQQKIEYDNIVVTNKNEAEEIVTELRNRIRDYDYATISDLYQLIDMPSDYNDHDWGWTDPKAIGLKKVNGGYLIDVDRAIHID